jgi:hypothetical protein
MENTRPLEWYELWAAMKEHPAEWITTTGEMYQAMLEAVPPQDMAMGAFLVGEPNHHNAEGEAVYACFTKRGGYRARYLTQREFRPAIGVMLP